MKLTPIFALGMSVSLVVHAQEVPGQINAQPTKIIGGVSDGSPSPPAPPKALPEFTINWSTVHQKKDHKVIINKVQAPAPIIQHPAEPLDKEKVEQRARAIEKWVEDIKQSGGFFTVSATIYDHRITHVRWWHEGRNMPCFPMWTGTISADFTSLLEGASVTICSCSPGMSPPVSFGKKSRRDTAVRFPTCLACPSGVRPTWLSKVMKTTMRRWSLLKLSMTDPLEADTDGDTLLDGWEVANGLDPNDDGTTNVINGAFGDPDNDGLTNAQEQQNNTNPNDADSDGDGVTDGGEVDQGTNPNDSNDTPEQEALIVTGDAEVGVPVEQSRIFRFPANSTHQLFIVGLHTEEYPNYTSGEACDGRQCPFNDRLRWNIVPSIGTPANGELDVNSLHGEWEQSEDEGLSLLGFSPIYIADMQVIEPSNDNETTVQTEAGATNVEDGALPSTVVVASLPIQLRDINDHAVENDDVLITPWNTARDIANENIAWIDAHTSAQNPAPRMPQLEFRIPNLPQGYRIEARMDIRYTRGNGARAGIVLLEDRVRVPADGSFQQVDGDTWQIWQSYQNERFFGGDGHIEYRIVRVRDDQEEVAPRRMHFRIGGENPDDARCRAYIETRPNAGAGGNLWYSYAIARSESRAYNGQASRYNQFLELPHHPRDVGRPLFGDDQLNGQPNGPGGYGMFQVTGTAANPHANIAREQIWNWQENVNAGVNIISNKRNTNDVVNGFPVGAAQWMARQRNANNANGVALPNHTVRVVTFSDGTNRAMTDAVTMKLYNEAHTTRGKLKRTEVVLASG